MLDAVDVDIQQLIFAAHEATRTGNAEEAQRLWAELLNISPEHPIALFHLGQQQMLRGSPRLAIDFFERAAKVDPESPTIPLNLALANRALGNSAAELAALERALALDPYYLPALLFKAAAVERRGRRRQAAQLYKNALAAAPPDDQLPPELQKPIAHAREVLARNAKDFEEYVKAALTPAEREHEGAGIERFRECKDAVLGAKKVYTQQPSLLHFPRLPALQYYDRSEFPWLAALEVATDKIRQEFLAAYGEDNPDFVPYIDHPDGVPLNQWAELNRSPRWSVLFFWKDGVRFDENCRRCPQTAAVVEGLPLLRIPNFSPNVNFSALAPKTRIPPHSGSTNVRLIVHLPLIVPEKCTFRVGNEIREWKVGKAWVFDDTIEHEAVNDSDSLRVILMLDIWNPYLSSAERELVSTLLRAMQAYYKEGVDTRAGEPGGK